MHYLLAGYSWSSFFSSIQNDLQELRNAVAEGATELMTYVRDSIPEEGEQPSPAQSSEQLETDQSDQVISSQQGAEEESFSGRLTGFLSSTFNKTKQLLSEALEEDVDSEASYEYCNCYKTLGTMRIWMNTKCIVY